MRKNQISFINKLHFKYKFKRHLFCFVCVFNLVKKEPSVTEIKKAHLFCYRLLLKMKFYYK